MITRITTFGGALLVLIGLIGFIAPWFMGMRLSPAHNFLFLTSGGASIYFGLLAARAAGRTFCTVLGVLYGLLGLAGFAAAGLGNALIIVPGTLILGTMDHVVHFLFGAVFLTVGWILEDDGRQFSCAAGTNAP